MMRKPRVLFISYINERVGPTNSLLYLIEHLRERFDAAVALPGRGELSRVLEERAIPFHTFPSLDRRAIPGLFRLIRREDIDLVYGNNQSSSSKNALIAAKLARVPFVCHIRGMSRRAGWRKLAFLRFSDANIAVSRACAESAAPYTGRRRMPRVIYNGISVTEWGHDREQARAHLRRSLGLPEEALVILSVAHLSPRKGQRHAVDAFQTVAEEMPAVRLLLVGSHDRDRAYVARLEEFIDELGLGGRVLMTGERRDILMLARGADVFVHTATADPHPRAVLEAMAAELPVVAFAVDGVAETVVHGGTGYLVPPGAVDALADRLVQLLRDPGLRARLGGAGRRRVARDFSAEKTATGVGRVIDEALGRRASERPPAAMHRSEKARAVAAAEGAK